MSHKDGRVVLSAWVDPVLRDYVREAARLSGLEFSRWVERAVRQTMARESADRAMAAARERGECARKKPCQCRGFGPPQRAFARSLTALRSVSLRRGHRHGAMEGPPRGHPEATGGSAGYPVVCRNRHNTLDGGTDPPYSLSCQQRRWHNKRETTMMTETALLCCEILRQGGAAVLQQTAKSDATGEVTTVEAVLDHCERELRAETSSAQPESFDFAGGDALAAVVVATTAALFGSRESCSGLPALVIEGVLKAVAPVKRPGRFGVIDRERNASLARNRELREKLETLVKARGERTIWEPAPSAQGDEW